MNQIANQPDPISLMPQTVQPSGPGIGKAIMDGAQDMGDFLIEAAGAALGKAVNGAVALAGKIGNGVSNIVNNATQAAGNLYNSNFIPGNSPETAKGHEIEAPGRGRGLEASAPSMGSEVTQSLSPASLKEVESIRQDASKSFAVANATGNDLGQAQNGVYAGIGAQQSQGRSL